MTEEIEASVEAGTVEGSTPGTIAETDKTQAIEQTNTDAWYSGFDAETQGWVQNRGYDKLDANTALSETIKGFRNVEKHMGVPGDRLVKLPEDRSDAEAMGQVYDKLGRPENPDAYEFKTPEDVELNTEFVDWAKNSFHKFGLSKSQGNELLNSYLEFEKGTMEATAAQTQEKNAAEDIALKKEWGAAYKEMEAVGQRAASTLGVTAEQLNALDEVLGHAKTMKLFGEIGSKIIDPRFVSSEADGGNVPGGAMTPAQALATISQLRADTEFVKKYTSGDVAAKARMQHLHNMAYPQE